jgi:uncharacterized protein (DUF983 family)
MNVIEATVKLKCPRCREGEIFETKNPFSWNNLTKMNETCSNCSLKYERETGFFYGAMYISSIINMIFFVIAIIAYYLFFVEKVDWRIYIWSYVLLIVLITPFLYRLSRSIWLQFFNDYQPNYHSEQ